MDDSGIHLAVSAPPSPCGGTMCKGVLLPCQPACTYPCSDTADPCLAYVFPGRMEMFCYEDPRTLELSPDVSDTLVPTKIEPELICSKRPRKESYSDLPKPPTTPVKKRRLSKTRASLVGDLHPVQLSVPSEDCKPIITPIQQTHLAGPAESSSCSDDKKKVLRAQEVDHAGFLPYEMDIYLHRRSIELNYHPVECLSNQPQLSPGMRGVLVEWLTKLCKRFLFSQDTLFLTINVLDRFLVTTPISRDIFQLLGITSLLVASKMEEQYPPEIAELLQLCEDSYTREQVRQLERVVLCRLRFDLMAPTSQFFLEHHAASRLRSTDIGGFTHDQVRHTRAAARYLLELSLQDYMLCQYAPSLLALSVLEVSDQLLGHSTRVGALYVGGYSHTTLQECMAELAMLTTAFTQSGPDMNSIYERYMNLSTSEDC